MESGSFRCDVNVSLGADAEGNVPPGRVELKNLNSLRSIDRAITYEVERQRQLVLAGEEIGIETRTYDGVENKTVRMRSKESAPDYRFLDEPDLPQLIVGAELIESIKNSLPELPFALQERLQTSYNISEDQATLLIHEAGAPQFFEDAVQYLHEESTPSALLNWLVNDLFGLLQESTCAISMSPVSPEQLADIANMVTERHISSRTAKDVLSLLATGKHPNALPRNIVEEKGWVQVTDEDYSMDLCRSVALDENHASQLEAFLSGKKPGLPQFFIGKAIRASGGKQIRVKYKSSCQSYSPSWEKRKASEVRNECDMTN